MLNSKYMNRRERRVRKETDAQETWGGFRDPRQAGSLPRCRHGDLIGWWVRSIRSVLCAVVAFASSFWTWLWHRQFLRLYSHVFYDLQLAATFLLRIHYLNAYNLYYLRLADSQPGTGSHNGIWLMILWSFTSLRNDNAISCWQACSRRNSRTYPSWL